MLTDAEEAAVRELLTRTRQNQFVGTPLRGGLPLVPQLTALPTASIDNVGRIVYVPGASGVADAAWICEKAAAGTYSWVPLDMATTTIQALIDATALGGELGGTVASATVDATHSGSAHAMILRYSNTSEVTTVSTSAVDLLTTGTLAIPVTSGIIIQGVARKSAGAAAAAGLGLKVNSTVTAEAAATASNTRLWASDATNQAEDGTFWASIAPRSANYLNGSVGLYTVNGLTAVSSLLNAGSPFPNATITSIAIRGISGSGSVTLAVKEVCVWELLYA